MQKRIPVLAATLAAAIFAQRPAAAEPTAQDAAVAQSLYDDGRKLMAAGQYESACPKLEESQRLDPTPSTLFHLSDCWDHVGKLASAWAGYLEVAAAARKENRADREEVANTRAKALAARLTKLTVEVPASSRVRGLEVKRGTIVVREGQWNASVPVDAGTWVIEASAPGKKTWTATVEIAGEAKSFNVAIPTLEDAPEAPKTPAEPAPARGAPPSDRRDGDRSERSALGWAGLGVAGAGVIGLGIGGYFGLSAMSKSSQSNDGPCKGNACTAEGVALRDDARSAGTLSTVFVASGAALAIGGAVLFFVAPKSTVRAAFLPAPGGGTLSAGARF